MSLGEKLTELRKNKKMSQEEVAEKLNVTRQTVSKWELDQSTPDFDKIIPLCELYGITSEELLTGKTKEKDNNLDNNNYNQKKRTTALVISIFLYFLSVVWIMISIPVLKIDPIVSSGIFLLIIALSTCLIIYNFSIYKREKKKDETENKLYKQIESVVSIVVLIIYLGISFLTSAWHITWIIWIIYALIMEIIKLVISLKGGEYEE